MSVTDRFRLRSILYRIGGWFNRVVPAWLFRFRIFRLYRLEPLASDRSPAQARPLEYRWCETDDEIALAQRLTYFHSDAQDHRERFRACLAHDGDELVGGVWQGTKYFDEEELGVRIRMESNQAWIFAAFVSTSHRGQRIYPRLLNHILSEDPAVIHYASINTTNEASIAAHKHFVTASSGRCVVFRLLSFTCCWAGSGLRLSRHLTLDRKNRPIEITIEL